MKQLRGDYLVSQDNFLIEARHSSTTETEAKLIASMVSMVEKEDKNFDKQRLSVIQFCELMEIKKPNYRHIKKACEKLIGKTISVEEILENGKTKWTGRTWFDEVSYVDGGGYIEFTFSNAMKPYLLDLNEFTQYYLSNIMSLNSTYAIRIYELSKRHQNKKIKTFTIDVEELRLKIGATQKSYNLFGSFKQKALAPALEEIENTTDIIVTYEEIKMGRKVTALKFTVKSNPKNKKKNQ